MNFQTTWKLPTQLEIKIHNEVKFLSAFSSFDYI